MKRTYGQLFVSSFCYIENCFVVLGHKYSIGRSCLHKLRAEAINFLVYRKLLGCARAKKVYFSRICLHELCVEVLDFLIYRKLLSSALRDKRLLWQKISERIAYCYFICSPSLNYTKYSFCIINCKLIL